MVDLGGWAGGRGLWRDAGEGVYGGFGRRGNGELGEEGVGGILRRRVSYILGYLVERSLGGIFVNV